MARTFSLQHRRPVRLRSSIMKPKMTHSDCPTVIDGFLNHIKIFETLPPLLYEWSPHSNIRELYGIALAPEINANLCVVQPAVSTIESQRFDTLITQQWLRVALWRLVYGDRTCYPFTAGTLLPASLPVDVGRTIMETLFSISQSSIDCLGLGIVSCRGLKLCVSPLEVVVLKKLQEQKFYNIGTSLADSAVWSEAGYSSLEVGARDLLRAVTNSLSSVRGGQSPLLPKLLTYSEDILSYNDPVADMVFHWDPELVSDEPNQDHGIDEVLMSLEQEHDETTQLLYQDIGI